MRLLGILGRIVFVLLAFQAWLILSLLGEGLASTLLPEVAASVLVIAWMLLVLPALILWLYRWLFASSSGPGAVPSASPFALAVDDDGVSLRRLDAVIGTVAWNDILGVDLFTTDEGPWAEDVYWVIHRRQGGEPLIVPGGAEGVDALLAAVEARLPGFDMGAVIRAMGSTVNARFALWQAPGVGA